MALFHGRFNDKLHGVMDFKLASFHIGFCSAFLSALSFSCSLEADISLS